VQTVGAGPDASYAAGKLRLGDGDAAGALAAFDEALRLDPEHLDARNGRATALARLGQTDAAIAELRRAAEAAPQAAHLHNNLGYLLLNLGRYDEAAQALRRAIAADPANPRYGANWAALTRRAPRLAVPAESSTVGASTAPPPAHQPNAAWSGPVVTLSWGSPPSTVRPPGASPPHAPAVGMMPAQPAVPANTVPEPSMRLEVSNGAGTSGLARRTAATLRGAGVPVARVTNHRDFRQSSTSIEYRAGHRETAARLQTRLGLPPEAVVSSDRLSPGVDLKLVLGRDATAGVAIDRGIRAAAPPVRPATPDRPATPPAPVSAVGAATSAFGAAPIEVNGQPSDVRRETATGDASVDTGRVASARSSATAPPPGNGATADYLEPLRAELRELRRLVGSHAA
jgi:hypothetical protein